MTAHFSPAERTRFGRAVMALFDQWHIDAADGRALLGVPDDTRSRTLAQYRQGASPLPDDAQIMARVKHFLSIEQSLDFMFPHNPALANYWITTESPRFGDRAPLQLMLDEGLAGIQAVAGHLDNSGTWD